MENVLIVFCKLYKCRGKINYMEQQQEIKKIRTAPPPQVFPVVFFSAFIPVTNIKGLETRDVGAMRLLLADC